MSTQLIDRENGQGRVLRDEEQPEVFSKGFYAKYGKRPLDVLSATLGLIVLSPVLALVACCIKLTSRGPVLYRQVRFGKGGRQFQILKFRSMVEDASQTGLGITVSGDTRVTAVGKFLRHHKVDELPQLWNVIRGDMSLVGPRPELPCYVAEYTREQRTVLSARPGITDPASLVYRYEEEILANHEDPEQFYRTQILPDKLARNIVYLQGITLGSDLRIIFNTVSSSFLFLDKTQERPRS
jgi:lipopolysaccharide/colanic/teichoic acid biosynthesis glycosyltransferase